ncbi:DUF4936 family protein [Leptothrix sp. BB-4]
MSLYVYYRVDPQQLDAARSSLRATQAALQADWPGLRAECLQRADRVDGEAPTWMEVYRHPDGLSPACLADLRQRLSDLPIGRLAGRHEERFVPLHEAPSAGR